MAVKEPPEKLSKHQKDFPRYKAIHQYEDSFKRAYAKELGRGLEEFSEKMNEYLEQK